MNLSPEKILERYTVPVVMVLMILITSFFSLKMGGMNQRWAVAASVLIICILIWPVVVQLTGKPWDLLWAVLILAIPLEFNIHLIYREYVGTFNGIMLTLTDAAVFSLICIWIFHLSLGRQPVQFHAPVTVPALLFLAAHLLSLVNTPDMNLSLFAVIQNSKIFLLYFLAANHIAYENRYRLMGNLLMVCLIIMSGVCILQFMTRSNFTTASLQVVENYGEVVFRSAGTTGSPNVSASYMASLLPLPLTLLLMNSSRNRMLPLVSLVMGLTGLILTQTRGAWLTFSIGVMVILVIHFRNRGIWKVAAVAVILAAAGLLMFGQVLWSRFSQGTDTLVYRLQLIRSAWEIFRFHPVFGAGTNIYAFVMSDYVPYFLTQERWIVHNRYLLVLAELGTTGLITFLIFLAAVFRSLIRASRSQNKTVAALARGLAVGLMVFCLQMLFESLDGRISDYHLWLVAGMAAGMGNKRFEEEQASGGEDS